VIPWIEAGDAFPPVSRAMREPNGLLAASRALSTKQLLAAYPRGIFPWYSEDEPVLWWSPDPRMVLFTAEFRPRRSLRQRLASARRTGFAVALDRAFGQVMRECAAPRIGQLGTWITEEMQECYVQLHRSGVAHSIEFWRDEALLGGLYGVAIGRMFFGESMFSRATDASKVALAILVRLLQREEVPVIDCQQHTAHLEFLGARDISRTEFCRHVEEATRREPVPWNRYRGVNLLEHFDI
jgi:leucyl/phenylalanyl-tRNA--protein transferase